MSVSAIHKESNCRHSLRCEFQLLVYLTFSSFNNKFFPLSYPGIQHTCFVPVITLLTIRVEYLLLSIDREKIKIQPRIFTDETQMKKTETGLIPQGTIEDKILLLRGRKIMLDSDLAVLYGVETKQLTRQVRRNIDRFPDDFMFQLTREEYNELLRCQIGTLKRGQHSKYLPHAFTEHGILMLSSVLNSKKAIQVNIQIMRTFTKLREMILTHKDLQKKIEDMEKRHDKHDQHFQLIFKTIKEMLNSPGKPKKRIGYR